MPFTSRRASVFLAACLAMPLADGAAQELEPERCPRLVAGLDAPVVPARFVLDAQHDETAEVRLTYVGHATFLIESPAGITIATDYNDFVRPDTVPDVATMNRAHTTHHSRNPEPGIAHLLPGWGEEWAPARHEVTIGDVWLRNVTTNIRSGLGLLRDMNSIFVFEVAGLCIAHLGHLHHVLTDDHLKALGRIDVVLAPVDGSYTLNIEDMIAVLRSIQAPLVVPMHFFSTMTLQRFLSRLGEHYEVELSASPTVTLSRASLPAAPTVLLLPGG